MDFCCPKCKCELIAHEGGAKRCERGHSFDRAREGYYNLLLSSGRGVHGDNAEMVLARRRFLTLGHYKPLALAIADAVDRVSPNPCAVLDAGCGEGYYTAALSERLKASGRGASVLALDISKDALKRASRLLPSVSFAVASSYDMPLPDNSLDVIVNAFSPLALDEVRRVLRTGGHFIFAFPGKRHLFSLKKAIYDTPYENKPEDTGLDGFSLVSERHLEYTFTLRNSEEVRALFMMTPYAYRTSEVGRARMEALTALTAEADFHILTYRRI